MVEKSRAMARQLDIPVPTAGTTRSSPWKSDGLPSPTSPLDRAAAPSPRGWRHLLDAGGVGLGILAALEAQPHPSSSVGAAPAPVSIARRAARLEVSELACSGRCATSLCGGVGGPSPSSSAARPAAATRSSFLSCCDMCRRALDGKDIFMYRGERAFCSAECRYHAIVSDEFQEEKERKKRRASAAARAFPLDNSKTDEMAGSPCNGGGGGQIFFTTGIVAA